MAEEREFTQEELIDIIGKAESLRQYDETKRALQESELVEKLSGETIPRLYSQEIMKGLLKFKPSDEDYLTLLDESWIDTSLDESWIEFTNNPLIRHLYFYSKKSFSRKRELAKLSFSLHQDYFNLKLHVEEQSFLNRCGEIILSLNNQMEKSGMKVKKYCVTHNKLDIINSY